MRRNRFLFCWEQIELTLKTYAYDAEVIFINDGSTDNTPEVLDALAASVDTCFRSMLSISNAIRERQKHSLRGSLQQQETLL